MIKYFLILFYFVSFSQPVIANSETANYWQCTSIDATNKQWLAQGGYKLPTINNALDACKKQSTMPTTCKAPSERCEVYINGSSTRAMWQCTAFDPMAGHWVGNILSNAEDAALAAKAYCQEQSSYPEACYVNLITCKNLNTNN